MLQVSSVGQVRQQIDFALPQVLDVVNEGQNMHGLTQVVVTGRSGDGGIDGYPSPPLFCVLVLALPIALVWAAWTPPTSNGSLNLHSNLLSINVLHRRKN